MKHIFLIVLSLGLRAVAQEISPKVNIKSAKLNDKNYNNKREIVVTDEDTIITTPVSKMVIKKKDFYQEKYKQPIINEQDSVIATPNVRIIKRKSN